MSNQVLVDKMVLALFDTIELWHMISVRAPASPHDLVLLRRRTTFAVRVANQKVDAHRPGVSHAMAVEPDCMTEVFGVFKSL